MERCDLEWHRKSGLGHSTYVALYWKSIRLGCRLGRVAYLRCKSLRKERHMIVTLRADGGSFEDNFPVRDCWYLRKNLNIASIYSTMCQIESQKKR